MPPDRSVNQAGWISQETIQISQIKHRVLDLERPQNRQGILLDQPSHSHILIVWG